MVTILGLGGFHTNRRRREDESLRLIRRAVDEGITFLDNCWDYHDGVAEERMGKALAEGGRRDKVFLMTKSAAGPPRTPSPTWRTASAGSRPTGSTSGSSTRSSTTTTPTGSSPRTAAHSSTRMKAKDRARSASSGFTGHKDPSIHLKMLGKPYDWATVQMPLNVMDAHYRSFQQQVLPELVKRGIGADRA